METENIINVWLYFRLKDKNEWNFDPVIKNGLDLFTYIVIRFNGAKNED